MYSVATRAMLIDADVPLSDPASMDWTFPMPIHWHLCSVVAADPVTRTAHPQHYCRGACVQHAWPDVRYGYRIQTGASENVCALSFAPALARESHHS